MNTSGFALAADALNRIGRAGTLKIVHVIVGLNVGGAELMLKRLLETHATLPEYEHSVISLTDLGVIGAQLRAQGVSVTTLGMRKSLSIPVALFSLFRQIRRARPDIVQTWMYHADLMGGLAARLAGVRHLIWGVRTTDIGKGGKRTTMLVRRVCARLSNWLPDVIVCAALASRQAHIDVGYAADRMMVIPNGFDLAKLRADAIQRKQLRLSLGIGEGELVVGSLGRFNPVKDHANFIAAAAMVAHQFPNARFLMVGRGLEEDNPTLLDLLAKSGIAQRFTCLGERQDVATCLSAMDVFCLHSRTEGFPNVLGEAMAMALPCVTTDVGDARHLLSGNGVVVPSQDSVALAEGMRCLLAMDETARNIMGQAAQARIGEFFTIASSAEKFRSVYDNLVGAKPR